jgi:hypothetical protein
MQSHHDNKKEKSRVTAFQRSKSQTFINRVAVYKLMRNNLKLYYLHSRLVQKKIAINFTVIIETRLVVGLSDSSS